MHALLVANAFVERSLFAPPQRTEHVETSVPDDEAAREQGKRTFVSFSPYNAQMQ